MFTEVFETFIESRFKLIYKYLLGMKQFSILPLQGCYSYFTVLTGPILFKEL